MLHADNEVVLVAGAGVGLARILRRPVRRGSWDLSIEVDPMSDAAKLFSTYPYLGGSLSLLLICGVAFALFPGGRRTMLLSGLLSAPYALASVAFVPEYWNPLRVVAFVAGPEDVMFSFANGCLVWLAGIWLVRRRVTFHIRPACLIRRYVACAALGHMIAVPLWLSGAGAMSSALCAIAAVGCVLLLVRRDHWPILVTGSIGFTLFYVPATVLVFALWPSFLEQWTSENLWGPMPLGIPLEEVAWAAAFGAVWPLLMAYVFDVQLANSTHRAPLPCRGWNAFRARPARAASRGDAP